MRRFSRLLSVVAVGCALMAVYNVFGDVRDLETVARRQSCATEQPSCRPRLARLRRSPFKQAFVFSVSGSEVEVDCTRPYLLFGDYQCDRLPRVALQRR